MAAKLTHHGGQIIYVIYIYIYIFYGVSLVEVDLLVVIFFWLLYILFVFFFILFVRLFLCVCVFCDSILQFIVACDFLNLYHWLCCDLLFCCDSWSWMLVWTYKGNGKMSKKNLKTEWLEQLMLLGWVPFALVKWESESIFFWILTSALEIRICKIHFRQKAFCIS